MGHLLRLQEGERFLDQTPDFLAVSRAEFTNPSHLQSQSATFPSFAALNAYRKGAVHDAIR